MSVPFKISSIEEPKFTVEWLVPDAEGKPLVQSFDPWVLQEQLAEKQSAPGANVYEVIRQVFGSGADNLSRNQLLALSQQLGDYIESLPVSKKALSQLQNSNASSASPSKS